MNKNSEIPSFSDYYGLIINISKTFSDSSGIDINEFISLAGERWTKCIDIFNPIKGKFITLFLYDFKYRCVQLIIKQKREKRTVFEGTKVINIDDDNYNIISNEFKIDFSDFSLLSNASKYMIKCLYLIKNDKQFNDATKQDIYIKVNKMVAEKYSRKKQVKALQQIAELIDGKVSKSQNSDLRTITFHKQASKQARGINGIY